MLEKTWKNPKKPEKGDFSKFNIKKDEKLHFPNKFLPEIWGFLFLKEIGQFEVPSFAWTLNNN